MGGEGNVNVESSWRKWVTGYVTQTDMSCLWPLPVTFCFLAPGRGAALLCNALLPWLLIHYRPWCILTHHRPWSNGAKGDGLKSQKLHKNKSFFFSMNSSSDFSEQGVTDVICIWELKLKYPEGFMQLWCYFFLDVWCSLPQDCSDPQFIKWFCIWNQCLTDARLQIIYFFLRGLQQFVNFKKKSISCMLLNLSVPIIFISVGPVVMLAVTYRTWQRVPLSPLCS